MDFKSFTEKITELGSKATELGSKAMSASIEALEKTTDFTYENLKKTPVMLKVPADFEAVRTEKKLVILVLWKDDAITKNMILQLPILFSKAWVESATLKTIAAEDSPDLVNILEATTPGVLFYRDGELKFKLRDDQIAQFVNTFDIRKDWNAPVVADAPVDPLTP